MVILVVDAHYEISLLSQVLVRCRHCVHRTDTRLFYALELVVLRIQLLIVIQQLLTRILLHFKISTLIGCKSASNLPPTSFGTKAFPYSSKPPMSAPAQDRSCAHFGTPFYLCPSYPCLLAFHLASDSHMSLLSIKTKGKIYVDCIHTLFSSCFM